MTIREQLNALFDETWVRVPRPNGTHFDLWVADYLGGHEETMAELEPLLDMETDDEAHMKIVANPETKRGKVPILVLNLYEKSHLTP